jgi:Kef-type K+ transport system membrane component KefB
MLMLGITEILISLRDIYNRHTNITLITTTFLFWLSIEVMFYWHLAVKTALVRVLNRFNVNRKKERMNARIKKA